MTDAQFASFPPLVVGTDQAAVRKVFRLPLMFAAVFLVVTALLAAFFAALMASITDLGLGFLTALPFLVSTTSLTFVLLNTAMNAGARAAAGTVLTLDSSGLASTVPQGTIALPWAAIESVTLLKRGRHRVLVFRLAPGVTHESPGVNTTVSPAVFRYLSKKGFRIGSAGIDTPIQTIADATAAFTAGRLVAR